MDKIACVIPTIRPEMMTAFKEKWQKQFDRYNVELVVVYDGKKPVLVHNNKRYGLRQIMRQDADLIYNLSDCVRNLGFAYIAKYLPDTKLIFTLDDDTEPLDNTIGNHIAALSRNYPVSWLSTANWYMRGFPYEIREEAEAVLSHGVWEGVKDYDAPTQLVMGNPDVTFYKGPIPKGIYYPMCGMNIMFKRKMLPYMYYAPMGYRVGMDRFTDIWLGITSKRIVDKKGWAVVSGYAKVFHKRASNVYKNLVKEAKGIGLNEGFWKGEEDDPYFKEYNKARKRWEKLIKKLS